MTLGRASAPTQVPISADGRRCQAAPNPVAHRGDSRTAGAIEALLDRSTTARATKRWRIDPVIGSAGRGGARSPVADATAGRRGRKTRMRSCRRPRPRDWKRGEPIAALEGARTAEAIVPAIEPDDRYPGIARRENTDVAASRCRQCNHAGSAVRRHERNRLRPAGDTSPSGESSPTAAPPGWPSTTGRTQWGRAIGWEHRPA